MDYSTISDQALDLGLFALDNELEGGRGGSEPMHYETFKQPVIEQLNYVTSVADEREIVLMS